MPEISLEQLSEKLEKMTKFATVMEARIAAQDETKEEEKEAKKAEEEKKEEEKMEAKKAKYNSAIKAANEETDHEKKVAMIKSANEEMEDKKHEAFGKPDEKKHEAEEEEKKENEAQIASIVNDKKLSLINQIKSANRIMNPTGLKEVEDRLKTASITEIEKEFNIVKPFIAGIETTHTVQPEKFIPFYANMTPQEVDTNQLSANSEASEFNKLTTRELLEMSK